MSEPISLADRIAKIRATPRWKLKGKEKAVREDADLDRRWQALAYRHAGKGYRQIAQLLNVSVQVAYEDVQWALDQVIREPAEQVLDMEVARLDELQAGIWDKAVMGDKDCIDRVLKIMDRRAQLLGLDRPKVIDMQFIAETAYDIAQQLGLDYMDVIREAELIVKGFMDGATIEQLPEHTEFEISGGSQ